MEVDGASPDRVGTGAEGQAAAPMDLGPFDLVPEGGVELPGLGARETLERQLEALKRLQAVYKVGSMEMQVAWWMSARLVLR